MTTATPPSKTLVLLFDGTGNFFKQEKTNIIRLFAALENNDPDRQLLYYQPGVGTYVSPTISLSRTFRSIAKLTDKALACFLSDHIVKGYRFLMQHYRQGDRICLFGFSRGAYTARALAGMLHKVGLLPIGNDEHLPFAWKYYKDGSSSGQRHAQEFKSTFSRDIKISFVGVWDTVGSVGFFGRHLGFTQWNPSILTFRHALSLDERRTKFQPNQRGDAPRFEQDSLSRMPAFTESRSIITHRSSRQQNEAFPMGRLRSRTYSANIQEADVRRAPATVPPSPSSFLPERPDATTSRLEGRGTPPNQTRNRRGFSLPPLPRPVDDGAVEALWGVSTARTEPEENHQNSQYASESVRRSVLDVDNEYEGGPRENMGENYREVWFPGCHSDVGGGNVATTSNDSESPNLANLSLGWMAKEAIKANVGLLFRSDAFQLYPGVLAIIGPENCNSGGIQIQEYLSTTDEIVAELAQILRLPAVPEVTPAQRFDALEAWTRRAHPEGQGAGEGILANAMEDFKQHPLVRDACGEMCDQLKSTRWWWFLEILPLWERRVQPDGTKSSGFRWNRGRGRIILGEEAFFHSSVLLRKCVRKDYKPRATRANGIRYVD